MSAAPAPQVSHRDGGSAAGARRPAPPAGRLGRLGRWAGGVLVTALALEAAVLECFLVPLRVGRWPVPVSVLAAVVGNVLLARLIVRVTGSRPAALLPPVSWLAVVLAFAAPRAEGDLVVPGSWVGLAFLFLGAVAGAYGAATARVPPGRHPSGGTAAGAGTTAAGGSPVLSG